MVPGSQNWGNHDAFLRTVPLGAPLPMEYEGSPVYVVMCPVKKGHIHFHHSLTWHGSGENVSNRPRRAIAIHFMSENTVYDASGNHPMKPFITVSDGQPVVGDSFPRVWSR
jgi:ectoine hydroxylase-related dioxygenase (phytanoyl-CoA dioxygenase family)